MYVLRLFFVAALMLIAGMAIVTAADGDTERCIGRADRPVALLELYTSEGCNSCPPADRWLSAFKSDPRQLDQVVPLAFHVDYWDYIGWKDRFADPRFGERQRDEAARAASRVVVTPQVFLNGRPLSGSNWNQDLQRVLDKQSSQPITAELELTATRVKGGWSVMLNGSMPRARKLRIFLVRYEQGLSSSVTAGENKGVRLNHDFVVRNWQEPLLLQSNRTFSASDIFRFDAKLGAQSGFAAVVEDADSGAPIQAVATKICAP